PEGSAWLEGWAVVGDGSEEDWQDVSLSLVSGTPVSFIQPIQNPLYRYRPVVPIPQDLNLSPQVYEAGEVGGAQGAENRLTQAEASASRLSGQLEGLGAVANTARGGAKAAQEAGQQQLRQQQFGQRKDLSSADNAIAVSSLGANISGAIAGGESGVETAATGSEVGELFEYRVEQPVTVRRDRSALIPILQTKMDGERVSVYNEAARRDRPMHGIRLKNT